MKAQIEQKTEASLSSSSSSKINEATDLSDENQGDSSDMVITPQNTGNCILRVNSQLDVMDALRRGIAALASPSPTEDVDPEQYVTGEFSMRQMDDEAQESYIEELEEQLADEVNKVAYTIATQANVISSQADTITVQADDIATLKTAVGTQENIIIKQEATISTQSDQLRSGSARLEEYEDLVLDFLRYVRPPALVGVTNTSEVVGNLCRTVVKAMLSFPTPEGLKRAIEAFDCIKESDKGGTSVRALFHYRVFCDLMAICDSAYDPARDISIILRESLEKLAQHVMKSSKASITRTIRKHTGNMRKEGIQGALSHLVENFGYYRTPEALSQAVLDAAMESFRSAAAVQGSQEQKKWKHPLDIEQVLQEWLDSRHSNRRPMNDHPAT
ncbi:hypothetical protein BCR39DRAFT_562483 [Naematelia encephala]|uniref:Uncharacterized protein n=1 Tax=Naematelia encephala TaxID=71784 RepID=A0A1Y2AI33_9TREE|nr:hypothetical protein BCR39DRAFT_562483 [Naematelia encephala]